MGQILYRSLVSSKKNGVVAKSEAESSTLAIPRSPSFIICVDVRNMFCVFRSRWRIFRVWRYCSAIQICTSHSTNCCSSSMFSCARRYRHKSPPSQNAITIIRLPKSFFVRLYALCDREFCLIGKVFFWTFPITVQSLPDCDIVRFAP